MQLPLADIMLLAALPVLLVSSGFFSGSETALFSLNHHQRLQMSRSTNLAGAAVIKLLDQTRALLITLLMANMLINVLFFVISTVVLLRIQRRFEAGGLVMAALSILPLLILILFGEVLPKLLAARRTVVAARFTALPLLALHRLSTPLRAAVNFTIITPLARLIAPSQRPPQLSGDELEALIALSQQRGVIDAEEERLLQRVLDLGQLKVRDLMVPRVQVQAYNLADEPAALIDIIRTTRMKRIPVYRGDLDHIVGLVYARQVLLAPPRTAQEIKDLIRQVVFVPELQRADQLLVQFRKRGVTVAIAVDEFGGTAGLVTLKDVVEHLVGPITTIDAKAVQRRRLASRASRLQKPPLTSPPDDRFPKEALP